MAIPQLSFGSRSQNYDWNVVTQDGEQHTVCCRVQSSVRGPLEVSVDGNYLQTLQYSGKSIVPLMEEEIWCGGEALLLVICGNRVDLVQKGRMINTKIPYEPTQKLSRPHELALFALSLLATLSSTVVVYTFHPLLSVMALLLGLMVTLSCGGLFMHMLAISPFYTIEKKRTKTAWVVLGIWMLHLCIVVCYGPLMQMLLS